MHEEHALKVPSTANRIDSSTTVVASEGQPAVKEGVGSRENNSQGGKSVMGSDSASAMIDTAAEASATEALSGKNTDRSSANSGEVSMEEEKKRAVKMEEEGENSWKGFKLGYTIPGLEELGVMIGFLSLFLFFFFGQLAKSSLLPIRDPYLEESLHHDTAAQIETEVDEQEAHH
ncbi:MAG: hypothetical protein ABIO24_03375, partial [Saprospiraceae bacterium]